MPNEQPDLRTLEGAMNFLDYHAPNAEQQNAHQAVNSKFQLLLHAIWNEIPNGPGKTVAIRKLNEARMSFNSAIANNGG